MDAGSGEAVKGFLFKVLTLQEKMRKRDVLKEKYIAFHSLSSRFFLKFYGMNLLNLSTCQQSSDRTIKSHPQCQLESLADPQS